MAAPRVSFSDKDMENGGEGGQERYVVVMMGYRAGRHCPPRPNHQMAY